MQNPNVSSSSLSDASQIRYQKAVREISKLIGMNNTMKRDTDNYRAMCENLQMQNRQLYETLQQFNNEKRGYEQRVQSYEMRIRELETTNESQRAKQESAITASMLEKERSKHSEQISILNLKLNEQGNTILHLQENVAQLQQVNKDLKTLNEQLSNDLSKEMESKMEKVKLGECPRCPDMKAKLQQANDYRMELEKQIIDARRGQYYVGIREGGGIRDGGGNRGRNEKDMVIDSLEDRIRIREDQDRRRNIEMYKLRQRLEKVENELKKYKDKERLMETTAIQPDPHK